MLEGRYEEQQLASEWNFKWKDAMVAKAPYTKRWNTYLDAYNGDYFKNSNLPDYRSNQVSNYIFALVETIRPIMLDNNPKYEAIPRQPDGRASSADLTEAFSYEWDREDLRPKVARELINTLVLGTCVFYIPYDSQSKQIKGIPVSPFNVFPDPLATSIEDAEYIIYADYFNESVLKRKYPEKAHLVKGGSVNYTELVYNNSNNSRVDNQVLILEVFTRAYEYDEEVIGEVRKVKPRYPNGRHLIVAPMLGIVFEDKSIVYEDGEFPFELCKDYDLPGKFWGEGEVAQLLSPQVYMNEMNNAIIDHAKTTANSPWIIDKNSGIPQGKITNRQGLIIRKNPGSEVKRENPPSMPNYVVQQPDVFKNDMREISGMFNSLRGQSDTGVYTAQGILALQEAGQVRIRLKVQGLETFLGKMARKWFSRMRQFWKEDKWIAITKSDGSYDFKLFKKDVLSYEFDLKITAGSTMPNNRSAMLDLMIRLAQTPMPDGQPLVDREAVAYFLPQEIQSAMLQRMQGQNLQVTQQMQQLQQMIEQMGQQMQQFMQQDQKDDEQTMSAIEQLVSGLEKVNQEILQLQGKHDKIEQEKKMMEKEEKIKTDSYNTGYTDAEKLYQNPEEDIAEEEDVDDGLPDEILSGIEGLSDDELALLVQKNPELIELMNK